jgi:hypothetical protein
MLAIGNPRSAQAHAHPPSQRLGVQQSLGQGLGHEKPADCSGDNGPCCNDSPMALLLISVKGQKSHSRLVVSSKPTHFRKRASRVARVDK